MGNDLNYFTLSDIQLKKYLNSINANYNSLTLEQTNSFQNYFKNLPAQNFKSAVTAKCFQILNIL